MTAREYNFDGLVGPTHNYAGLSHGNVASLKHSGQPATPARPCAATTWQSVLSVARAGEALAKSRAPGFRHQLHSFPVQVQAPSTHASSNGQRKSHAPQFKSSV